MRTSTSLLLVGILNFNKLVCDRGVRSRCMTRRLFSNERVVEDGLYAEWHLAVDSNFPGMKSQPVPKYFRNDQTTRLINGCSHTITIP